MPKTINEIDKILYTENPDDATREALEKEYDTLLEKRNRNKELFEKEREQELVSDIYDLTGKTIDIDLKYVETIYVTFISRKRELDYYEYDIGVRRITPEEKKELETLGYDVYISSMSYQAEGSIDISDSDGELLSTLSEGHEAGHSLMELSSIL